MSTHAKLTRWRNVGRFCIERVTDYSELLALEVEQTRKRLVRELSALVALAVAGLFTLSFVCIAIIATAWQTPYFLEVVWGVAAAWLLVCVVSFLVVRTQRPAQSLHVLKDEIRSDLDACRESLK
ncbi:phage holin family protein [Paraburkholderia sp. MMS20-SJTN17]|uniref:Phage holin family protein n=1 Tax=Paraburkholderia translucens TaxID=2886945 RepID=A0ABS8KC32_9BURK|nr:phage holin family protein [Paraburkholderia sp. MMS20-SJTN17]MCC8402318.1 phage holin family protein [Paraburkholderia sp. MMS20-SJTN17]